MRRAWESARAVDVDEAREYDPARSPSRARRARKAERGVQGKAKRGQTMRVLGDGRDEVGRRRRGAVGPPFIPFEVISRFASGELKPPEKNRVPEAPNLRSCTRPGSKIAQNLRSIVRLPLSFGSAYIAIYALL
jgi:hypothetical protein